MQRSEAKHEYLKQVSQALRLANKMEPYRDGDVLNILCLENPSSYFKRQKRR